MDKNEIEKRMNAAVDLVAWLNQRIEEQVELQVGQRLEREREVWQGVISSLITKEVGELVRTSHGEMIARVQQMLDRAEAKLDAELVRTSPDAIMARVQQMLDQAEAKLDEPMHRTGDDAPPSKH